MAERTLAENVAQVKADFKAIKDAVPYVFNDDTPTSEYGERIFTEISSLQYQADSAWDQGFYNGIEQGRVEGYENGKTDGITEGVEQGKQEVISNSKYIEKSASGTEIRLDDVSEVYHNVKVYADTPTEVKVYGKNLFNNDTSLLKEVSPISSSGTQFTRIGYEPLVLPSGTYTFTLNDSGTVTDKYIYGVINDKDGNYVAPCTLLADTNNKTPLTITVNEGDKIYIYDGNTPLNVSASAKRFNSVEIQLEVGVGTNEYEPYQEPQTITATPSGTEVSSICPIMIFLADSDVTVDYFGSYGMQTEWDRFWDGYQDYGKRTSYAYGFSNQGWNDETFKPKYDIALTNYCFYNCRIKNLASALSKQGVRMTSSATSTNLTYAFTMSWIEHIPEVDMSKATVSDSMFSQGSSETSRYLKNIEKIISSEKTVFANNCFNRCSTLEHVIFEGTIASDINLQWSSKLDLESLISLFECLKHFGGSGNEYTKTITLSPESWVLTNREEFITRFDGFGGQDVAHQKGWNYA